MSLLRRNYYVYLMTNPSHTVIYTGITNDLKRRIFEHKNEVVSSFAKKYNVKKLVYYEIADDPYTAITREKQIKGGSRMKKMQLVKSMNPEWKELCAD